MYAYVFLPKDRYTYICTYTCVYAYIYGIGVCMYIYRYLPLYRPKCIH